ncbi:MAG: RNA 2',3'-cyclic phosphodiesterase [Nanoarchaeota archaeon]
MELKRCFIALNLPLEAVNEIRKVQKLIKDKNLFIGRFTELENLHLTLKFLGEITENKIDEIKERLNDVRFRTFEGQFGGVGVFSESFVKIIWVELIGDVFELQKQIDEKLNGLFEPEKIFMSHITIARVKHVDDKKKLIEFLKNITSKKIKFKIDNFYLMKSELKPEGPLYKVIEKCNLVKQA